MQSIMYHVVYVFDSLKEPTHWSDSFGRQTTLITKNYSK